MRLGFIGLGMVGATTAKWFAKNTDHTLAFHDPAQERLGDMEGYDACFISVPVDTQESGEQDVENLKEAMEHAVKCNIENIFIRSTVLPGTCQRLGMVYGVNVWAMPEFLSEKTAEEDFERNQIITGCPDEELLAEIFIDKPVKIYTNRECELAKYTHNTFAAMKVWFFNEIHGFCEASDMDYQNVLDGALTSGYVDRNHTMVPGPDGKKGYGGKCLPKDLKAFAHQTEHPVLKLIHQSNSATRGDCAVSVQKDECCGGGCH